MVQIRIDTDRPEYVGAAKWPELARVLRDLADKCEQPMREEYKTSMILMDGFGQYMGQMAEITPTDVQRI